MPPRDLGLPFSTWSLSKLAEHLVATGVVASISREPIRGILRAGGITWQATKTWKASDDPDFAAKMRRVLDLNRHGGARHMPAASNPASGKMIYRIRARKRSGEFLSFLKILRARRRNSRAEPERDFAPESTIRTWTGYMINIA